MPFSSFYFRLSFLKKPSKVDVAFQEVTGLSAQMDVEEVTCGGENRFKYRLPTTPKYQNLILKRGVTYADSPLRDWCSDTLTGGLDTRIKPKDLKLWLLNANNEPCFTWLIYSAYPVAWQASELNSEKNQLLIETIELCFRYFKVEMHKSTKK